MATTIQNQKFGVEIELTGITRRTAAKIIADYFDRDSWYIGQSYKTYGAHDRDDRTWKAMSDASIQAQVKRNGVISRASDEYKCEIVTPILQYRDIYDLQAIIRLLVKAGAMVNDSCGIHIHVDGAAHDHKSLTRLVNFAIGRQDLFYEALQIGNRSRWCEKMNADLLKAMKQANDRSSMERAWYSPANDGYLGGVSLQHYNPTRYHGINLHAFFTKGTVEFRLFNGTTHAGKIKAYIQFCLAMSAWAVNAEDKMYYKSCKKYTVEQKGKLMMRVLRNRLGLKGDEFKTARLHLTSAFAAIEVSAAA